MPEKHYDGEPCNAPLRPGHPGLEEWFNAHRFEFTGEHRESQAEEPILTDEGWHCRGEIARPGFATTGRQWILRDIPKEQEVV